MKTRFFDLARRAARHSNCSYLMGAVVVQKNRIVSLGCNKDKTHPRSKTPWHTIHAELDAVLYVPYDRLYHADLYIVRITRNGSYSMSRPCSYCWNLLQSVNIKHVYYTDREGRFCKEKLHQK